MSASFIHRDPLALNQNPLHILNGSKVPGSTCGSTQQQHDYYSISSGSATCNTTSLSRSHTLDESISLSKEKKNCSDILESQQQQQPSHNYRPIQSPKMSPDSTLTVHLPIHPITSSSSSVLSSLAASSSISARTTPNSPGQQSNVSCCGVATGSSDAYFHSTLFNMESVDDKQRSSIVGSSTTGLGQSPDITTRQQQQQQQHFHYYQQHQSYQSNSSPPTSIMRPRAMTTSFLSRSDTSAMHTSPTAPSSTTTPVKKSSRRNPWGSETYSDLISVAIHSYPDEQATLQQIYDFIITHYEYFRQRSDATSSAGWKNSIRHNLSLHDRFTKCPKSSDNSKSSYWRINPDVASKPYVRRRACSMDTGSLKRPSNLQHPHHSSKISSMTNRTSFGTGGHCASMDSNRTNTGPILASTVPSSTSTVSDMDHPRQQQSTVSALCELDGPPPASDPSTDLQHRTPSNVVDRNEPPTYEGSTINLCNNKAVDYARSSSSASLYQGVHPIHHDLPQHCNGNAARWLSSTDSTIKGSSGDMTLLTDGRASFSGQIYPSGSSERPFTSRHNAVPSNACNYRVDNYASTDQSNAAKFVGSGGLIEQLLRSDATLKLHPQYTASAKPSKANLETILDRNGVGTYVPNSFQAVVSQPAPALHDVNRMPSKHNASHLRYTFQHPYLFNTGDPSGSHDSTVDMKTQSSFHDPSESNSISHHLQPVPLSQQQYQSSGNNNGSISSAMTTPVDWSSTNSPSSGGYVPSLKPQQQQTCPSVPAYHSDGLRSKHDVLTHFDHHHHPVTDGFIPQFTNASDGLYSRVTSSWSRTLSDSETQKSSTTLSDCRLLEPNTPPNPMQHHAPASFSYDQPCESGDHQSNYATDSVRSTCDRHTSSSISLNPYEDSYLYDDCEPLELELSLELADRIVGSTRTTQLH